MFCLNGICILILKTDTSLIIMNQFKSIANLIIARGDTTNTFHYNMSSMEDKVKSVLGCVTWNPFPLDVWTGTKQNTYEDFIQIDKCNSINILSQFFCINSLLSPFCIALIIKSITICVARSILIDNRKLCNNQ